MRAAQVPGRSIPWRLDQSWYPITDEKMVNQTFLLTVGESKKARETGYLLLADDAARGGRQTGDCCD
jgi:hypothetical protein